MSERVSHAIPAFRRRIKLFREGPGTEWDDPSILYCLQGETKDWIVRAVQKGDMSEMGSDITDSSVRAKNLFDELENVYGVRVAPTHFVVTTWNKKHPSEYADLFILTEKITACRDAEDVTLLNRLRLPKRERSRLEEEYMATCQNLLRYYGEKRTLKTGARGHGNCLSDIGHPRQYMWGKKQGDDNNHLYLVDTDPQTFGVWNAAVHFGEFIRFGRKTLKLDMSEATEAYRSLLVAMEPDQADYFVKRIQ